MCLSAVRGAGLVGTEPGVTISTLTRMNRPLSQALYFLPRLGGLANIVTTVVWQEICQEISVTDD
jgi:hypothetical protein